MISCSSEREAFEDMMKRTRPSKSTDVGERTAHNAIAVAYGDRDEMGKRDRVFVVPLQGDALGVAGRCDRHQPRERIRHARLAAVLAHEDVRHPRRAEPLRRLRRSKIEIESRPLRRRDAIAQHDAAHARRGGIIRVGAVRQGVRIDVAGRREIADDLV